jgi:hypothetical protein
VLKALRATQLKSSLANLKKPLVEGNLASQLTRLQSF